MAQDPNSSAGASGVGSPASRVWSIWLKGSVRHRPILDRKSVAGERGRKRDLLRLDCGQVRRDVHSANHHNWKDECRSQEALGEHTRFPNL